MEKKDKIIGYTVGSFDMFHIGHLNILKKAKKNCDFLIVGLNSDETMWRVKKKKPIVPFEERKAIVEAIRYVDKVVKVECAGLYERADDYELRVEADIVFSGDDHLNDPDWKQLSKEKQRNGTKIMMFPYTKTTSSTILRQALEERINELS